MLFHMSIAARDPERVARVIAELWEGVARRFPPVAEGSWVAAACDERGTTLEIYPAGTVLREADGDADAYGELSGQDSFTATHAAIATNFDRHSVLAICEREGWPAKYRNRGGFFGVIEMWIEGRQLIEVLTPEMQREYRAAIGGAALRRPTAVGPLPAP